MGFSCYINCLISPSDSQSRLDNICDTFFYLIYSSHGPLPHLHWTVKPLFELGWGVPSRVSHNSIIKQLSHFWLFFDPHLGYFSSFLPWLFSTLIRSVSINLSIQRNVCPVFYLCQFTKRNMSKLCPGHIFPLGLKEIWVGNRIIREGDRILISKKREDTWSNPKTL